MQQGLPIFKAIDRAPGVYTPLVLNQGKADVLVTLLVTASAGQSVTLSLRDDGQTLDAEPIENARQLIVTRTVPYGWELIATVEGNADGDPPPQAHVTVLAVVPVAHDH
ncbi:MAG: hypothetical protein H6725_12525 [Sandaracinaceae bacterium]|nr:hypothetical protein [Sandaracinaceae bacterium]